MPQNFSGKKLRGRNFTGQNLTEANFSKCDIRGANFTNAILKGANFRGAKAGLQERWSFVRLFFLLFLSLTAMDLTKFFYYSLFNSLPSNISSWIDYIFLIAPALIFYTVLFFTIVRKGFTVQAFRIVLKVIASIYAARYVFSTTINLGAIRLGFPLLGDVNLASAVIAFTSIVVHATMIVVLVTIIGVHQAVVVGVCLIEIIVLLPFLHFQLLTTYNIPISLPLLLNNPSLLFNIFLSALIILVSGYIGWLALNGYERFQIIRTLGMIISSIGGTNFHGADLTEANFLGAFLRNTDFEEANLTRTRWFQARKMNFVIPGETYLKFASVQNLITTLDGISQNFARKDLRGINLKGAKLQNASFIDTDLSQADLRDTDLSGAILVHTRLEQADLTGANLTGSCIQDWFITKNTILNQVKCEYVFMRYVNEGKLDQMPPQGEFKAGEFVIFIRSILDTLELYHNRDINPRFAIIILKSLSEDYNESLQIVGLEKRGDGIILKLKTSEWLNQEQIKEEYYSRYSKILTLSMQDPDKLLPEYKVVETNEILAKIEEKVEEFKRHPTTNIEYLHSEGLIVTGVVKGSVYMNQNKGIMQKVSSSNVYGGMEAAQGNNNQQTQETNINTDTMTNNPGGFSVGGSVSGDINNVQGDKNQQRVSNKTSNFNLQNAQFGGGLVNADTVNAGQIGGNITNYNPEQRQNLAQAAAEIGQLLNQLSQSYPTATTSQRMSVVAKAVDEIESNPTLKARVIGALKAGGTEAFKELIDHPLVNILLASIDGWQEAE